MADDSLVDAVRSYWDEDAAVYDRSPSHMPVSRAVLAAWSAALESLLPPAPAQVLDVGAGTGFLSLVAARIGHAVTALDLSPGMLEKLGQRATSEGLDITRICGPADIPPPGPFDAVIERHVMWLMPDPVAALTEWKSVVPSGRLVLIESRWGSAAPLGCGGAALRRIARRTFRVLPDHHAEFPEEARARLPLGDGTPPSALLGLTASAGWREARYQRLRDVERAERVETTLRGRLSSAPRFAIVAVA